MIIVAVSAEIYGIFAKFTESGNLYFTVLVRFSVGAVNGNRYTFKRG